MKQMRLSFFITLVFLLSFSVSNAQALSASQLEQNYAKVQSAANDTAKVNALNFLAKYHINGDQDSGRFYADKALALAQKLDYKRGVGMATLTRGILEGELGNYP